MSMSLGGGEEIRRDDPVEYFLPMGSEVPFEFQRG